MLDCQSILAGGFKGTAFCHHLLLGERAGIRRKSGRERKGGSPSFAARQQPCPKDPLVLMLGGGTLPLLVPPC